MLAQQVSPPLAGITLPYKIEPRFGTASQDTSECQALAALGAFSFETSRRISG